MFVPPENLTYEEKSSIEAHRYPQQMEYTTKKLNAYAQYATACEWKIGLEYFCNIYSINVATCMLIAIQRRWMDGLEVLTDPKYATPHALDLGIKVADTLQYKEGVELFQKLGVPSPTQCDPAKLLRGNCRCFACRTDTLGWKESLAKAAELPPGFKKKSTCGSRDTSSQFNEVAALLERISDDVKTLSEVFSRISTESN